MMRSKAKGRKRAPRTPGNKDIVHEEPFETDSGPDVEQQGGDLREEVTQSQRTETSEPENNHTDTKIVDELLDDDEDDDEEPEDVSWKVSREAVVSNKKKQDESLLSARHREKQTRRLRDEWLKQQKRDKVAREHSRLPDDVLQIVAKTQEEKGKSEQEQVEGKHITFDEGSDSESCGDEFHDMVGGSQVTEPKGITVTVLKQKTARPKKNFDSAMEFLQQHLYGDRLHRVPAIKALSHKRKNKTQGPAVKFAK